jgi:acetoin:2,6-dichlorophenolindophenol oxidoreductase subunit alpha
MGDNTPAGLYRTVRLIRRFEEVAIDLVRSGEIVGGIHPYIGEEAIAAGACAALRDDDAITSTHRGHGHVLAKGADPARMLAELAGRVTGLNRGRGGSMHAADFSLGILGANAIVGAAAPIAAGAAWAAARLGRDRVVVSFFGDGAVSQGVLLETLNLAALRAVPVVFVCENNRFSTSMRVEQVVAGSITGRAEAFGIPAHVVDGMDPQAVHDATAAAVALARSGGGPSFLECRTYRGDAHHTMEYRSRPRYRTDDEIRDGRSRDPVEIAGDRLPLGVRAAIDTEIEAVLAAALEFTRAAAKPDPAGALDYLYADGMTTRPGVS